MINIHRDLLPELDHNEMWLLLHIVKRINKQSSCYPSVGLLQEETGFSRAKVFKVIKSLKEKRILSVRGRGNKNGSKASNLYIITTALIGVFISAKIRFGQVEKFYEFIKTKPEITECYKLTGNDCLMMKANVRNTKHLDELNSKLSHFGELTTSLILSDVVDRRVYNSEF